MAEQKWNKGGIVNLKVMVLFGVFLVSLNLSAWQKDGVPIATGPGDQTEPQVVISNFWGFYVIYKDYDQNRNWHYCMLGRFGKNGDLLWSSPIKVCQSAGFQRRSVAVGSPSGSIITAFEDARSGNSQVYLSKIDSSGEYIWNSTGIAPSPGSFDQEYPQFCLDGSGEGCYVTWTDYRTNFPNVWAAHVTKDGQVAWTAPVCSLGEYQFAGSPIAIKSGDGCIIVWGVSINNGIDSLSGVYGQRIVQDSFAGQWGYNGKLIIPFNASYHILSDAGPYFFPYAVEDNRGGTVVWDIFGANNLAQRVDSSGNLLWPSSATITIPLYCGFSNGASGMIGCMGEYGPYSDVRVVQIDSSGNSTWGKYVTVWNGLIDSSGVIFPTLVDDGHHGAVITWVQNHYPSSNLMVTRVDSSGQVKWTPPKVICGFPAAKDHPLIVKGPNNGYIVVWEDTRNGNTDLYAQYVDSAGQSGINEITEKELLTNEGLLSNEPNPFTQTIRIKYGITSPGQGELTVFDVTGRKVKELIKDIISAGIHTAIWNGKDESGKKVPSGVYYCQFRIQKPKGNLVFRNKIIFLEKEDQ